MESTEPRRGFGTTVLVLLLALAFLVGTALFVYVGYQLLGSNGRSTAMVDAPTATPPPSPTATLAPTGTPEPSPTAEPLPTLKPTTPKPTPAVGGGGTLPQTGLGSLASIGTLLLAGVAVGARWLRHRH